MLVYISNLKFKYSCSFEKGGMMADKFFNPELFSKYAIRYFVKCPGLLALGWHGSVKEHTDIYCEDEHGNIHIFYVPPHGISVRKCGSNERDYIFIKVCSFLGIEPDVWLVTDYLRRTGYSFPAYVFDQCGRDLLLGKEIIST